MIETAAGLVEVAIILFVLVAIMWYWGQMTPSAWDDMLQEKPQSIRVPIRFFKFALVGASGVVVNTAILYSLHTLLAISLIPSSIIAVEASVLSNYLLNAAWTFSDRDTTLQSFYRFHLVSIVPIVANITILYFATSLGMYYLYANLLGIAAGMIWNYLLNTRWTFPE